MIRAVEPPKPNPDEVPPPSISATDLPESEIRDEIKKRAGILASFSFAINGVLRTLCTQRNMKIHWVSGTAVMMVGMALNLDLASRASVMVCVFMVICMEVLNTALEAFVDLYAKDFKREAMIAKDAAAAAVLVLAIGAAVVLADVLLHAWRMVMSSGQSILRTILLGLPILTMEGFILGAKRNVGIIVSLLVACVLCLTVLAYYSRDEVFSLGALAFLMSAAYARWREPELVV